MKKLTLEATDENVLNSIRNNTYNRRDDIKEFVESLEMIEGNAFISLDARWGEGKTFYVRQIEKTLEYTVKKKWGNLEDIAELKPYFENTNLDAIDLKQSYLPIYYNAWLYDNHNDPLMSLLFSIVKQCKKYIDTQMDSKTLLDNICTIVSSINLSVSVDVDRIKKGCSGKDIFEEIKTAEEIREVVKDIFNEVIVGAAQKLVIFIDELDRCRPSFAIEMLERIKHYFDDDRIIFIVSVNKEQLVHTISKFYGDSFDSTGYLNKFFDLNTYMPMIQRNSTLFENHNSRQFWLIEIADGLNDYYKLSIRDSLIFKNAVLKLDADWVNDDTPKGICLSAFVPIIIILGIVDDSKKKKFIKGETDVFEKLVQDIPVLHDMICRFGELKDTKEEQFEIGIEKIRDVYEYTFKKNTLEGYNKLKFPVPENMKNICLKLSGKF